MILSMSSSRAVSMRIGTSERWRTRRQTSIPSKSGSMRSSTINDGASAAACSIAPSPVSATRTAKPARFRYMATKEAMLGSSSTMRIEWLCARLKASHPDTDLGRPCQVGSTAEPEPVRRGLSRPALEVGRLDAVPAGWSDIEAVERHAATHESRSANSSTTQPQPPPPRGVVDPEAELRSAVRDQGRTNAATGFRARDRDIVRRDDAGDHHDADEKNPPPHCRKLRQLSRRRVRLL